MSSLKNTKENLALEEQEENPMYRKEPVINTISK
jgi:hypothetical protein